MSMADLERQLLTNDRLSNVITALQNLSQRGTNIQVLIATLRHTVAVSTLMKYYAHRVNSIMHCILLLFVYRMRFLVAT
jgi:hypothetical protein